MRRQLPSGSSSKNFRTSYYKSLGVKVGSDQSILISFTQLLSENVVNVSHLVRLGIQFGVPSTCRALVWKLVFEVLPIYRETWDYAQQQKDSSFPTLERTCQLLELVTRPHEISNKDKIVHESLLQQKQKVHVKKRQNMSIMESYSNNRKPVTHQSQPAMDESPLDLEINGAAWYSTELSLETMYIYYREIRNLPLNPWLRSDISVLSAIARVFMKVFETRSDAFWAFSACIDLIAVHDDIWANSGASLNQDVQGGFIKQNNSTPREIAIPTVGLDALSEPKKTGDGKVNVASAADGAGLGLSVEEFETLIFRLLFYVHQQHE